MVVADSDVIRSEQRALFDMSPAGQELGAEGPPLFPNLVLISRDRAHRFRSVQKGTWNLARLLGFIDNQLPTSARIHGCYLALTRHQVSDVVRNTLDDLVTGKRSLAAMLRDSRKYQQVFQAVQKVERDRDIASTFADIIKDLRFADQRFDSRSRPLFRLFQLLPVAIEALAALAGSMGDKDDQLWASVG